MLLELEASSLILAIIALITNLALVSFVRKNDVILRLILFSLFTDVFVAFSTIVTSGQKLLQTEAAQGQERIFCYSLVPLSIFADMLQTTLCLDFAIDRLINFAAPSLYSTISAASTSWCTFSCVLSFCFIFSGLITYEVQRLSDISGFNGTVVSFLQDDFFDMYFDSLFCISAIAFLFCVLTLIIAAVRYTKKNSWEVLHSNSYFLLPSTIVCVIRGTALLVSFYAVCQIKMDKEFLLPVSRLLSTASLLILQPGSIYLSLKWYNKHQESKKLQMKKSSNKRLPKNATVGAMIAPALMINATEMSVLSTPMIGVNMYSNNFMEERANRERSVSFYQVVRHNATDIFLPETPFGDKYPFV